MLLNKSPIASCFPSVLPRAVAIPLLASLCPSLTVCVPVLVERAVAAGGVRWPSGSFPKVLTLQGSPSHSVACLSEKVVVGSLALVTPLCPAAFADLLSQ